jgi:predicted AlkP superfamily phosphohydrolase/phosphomutase
LEACERLVADLITGAERKAALLDWVADQGPFDLFLGVFAETHWAMHLLWHTLDTEHPEYDPALATRCGPVFERICRIIDEAIGRLLRRHPEARFVVFSLSGMGPNYSGWHLLPELLRRMGLAAPGVEAGLERFGAGVLGRVERIGGLALVERVKGMLPAGLWDTWSRRLLFARTGWGEARAFCLPNDQSGAIRVNLAGREPNGLVAPGDEQASLCHEIEEALRGLVHPLTGRPIVEDVILSRKVFPGEHADDLPDLVVIWNTEAPIAGASSERLGTWHASSPEQRTGGHRNEGFVLAAGPEIIPGSAPEVIDLVDVPASILSLCDADAAADLDGEVIPWTA